MTRHLDPQVVQATLVMLTTCTIAKQVLQFKDVEQVFICGGGARNEFLVEELESELHECELFTTDELGVEANKTEVYKAVGSESKIDICAPSIAINEDEVVFGKSYGKRLSLKLLILLNEGIGDGGLYNFDSL